MPESPTPPGRGTGRAFDRVLVAAVALVAVALVVVGVYTWQLLPNDKEAPTTAYGRDLAVAQAAVDKAPDDLRMRLELANVHFQYKDYDRAAEVLDDARSIETTNAEMKAFLEVGSARTAEATGDEAAARKYYKASLEHFESFDAFYALGVFARDDGETETAVEYWENAIEISPGAATLRVDLAKEYIALGRKEDAARQLKEAQRYLPGNAEIEQLLADVGGAE